MVSTKGFRKSLQPLGQGPWLTDRSTTWMYGRLGLLACGGGIILSLMLPRQRTLSPPDWVGTVVGSMLLLFFAAACLLVITLMCWWDQGLVQFCPDCLKSMDRGAYVCPWCGFRETLRKEHP